MQRIKVVLWHIWSKTQRSWTDGSHLTFAAITASAPARVNLICNMLGNMLNDLAEAIRRWTEKKNGWIASSHSSQFGRCFEGCRHHCGQIRGSWHKYYGRGPFMAARYAAWAGSTSNVWGQKQWEALDKSQSWNERLGVFGTTCHRPRLLPILANVTCLSTNSPETKGFCWPVVHFHEQASYGPFGKLRSMCASWLEHWRPPGWLIMMECQSRCWKLTANTWKH